MEVVDVDPVLEMTQMAQKSADLVFTLTLIPYQMEKEGVNVVQITSLISKKLRNANAVLILIDTQSPMDKEGADAKLILDPKMEYAQGVLYLELTL